MRLRENTFAKIISLIILLLIPIILLYTLSMQTSIQVIKDEVRSLKQKDINFLANEFDKSVTTLTSLGFLLNEDIHIQSLQTLHLTDSVYERNNERLRIMERLRLLNVSQRWDTQYSILAPSNQEFVSTNRYLSYDLDKVKSLLAPEWKYQEVITQNISQKRFVRHIVRPKNKIANLDEAGIIIEISFPEEHIIKDLDTFKETGKGDPFLYNMDGSSIQNKNSDKTTITTISDLIQSERLVPTSSNQIINISKQEYLVLFAPIDTLGWYLVDYVPIDNMLQPIVKTQILFYVSVVLLLVMSLLAGYLLYRNVQRPIALLIRNVRKLQDGDYSTRIKVNPKNEFSYLFERFNDMTAETERLIEKVYMEELRLREANVKQLQSQINPHFLYNCFALIRSLARLNKTESVMTLSMHLSKYYRYTTRVEKLTATLTEEVELLRSYLEIQQFHIQHMSYHIEIPEYMLDLEIPRLLLQPIAENAVLHGIEQYDGDGIITISAETVGNFHSIIVEDNGVGMTEEQLEMLEHKLFDTPDDNSGCALWNIRQRMIFQFGPEASINFSLRPSGGLIVRLSWISPSKE